MYTVKQLKILPHLYELLLFLILINCSNFKLHIIYVNHLSPSQCYHIEQWFPTSVSCITLMFIAEKIVNLYSTCLKYKIHMTLSRCYDVMDGNNHRRKKIILKIVSFSIYIQVNNYHFFKKGLIVLIGTIFKNLIQGIIETKRLRSTNLDQHNHCSNL